MDLVSPSGVSTLDVVVDVLDGEPGRPGRFSAQDLTSELEESCGGELRGDGNRDGRWDCCMVSGPGPKGKILHKTA